MPKFDQQFKIRNILRDDLIVPPEFLDSVEEIRINCFGRKEVDYLSDQFFLPRYELLVIHNFDDLLEEYSVSIYCARAGAFFLVQVRILDTWALYYGDKPRHLSSLHQGGNCVMKSLVNFLGLCQMRSNDPISLPICLLSFGPLAP